METICVSFNGRICVNLVGICVNLESLVPFMLYDSRAIWVFIRILIKYIQPQERDISFHYPNVIKTAL